MKILCHVVMCDTGLAPNPFHGYCTTAVCTPSHRNAKLEPGDWIVGHTSASATKPRHLVYAMRVDEILGLDAYFRDARFQAKKPRADGTAEDCCGDNIYFKHDNVWCWISPSLHDDSRSHMKDIGKGNPRAFISEHFFYFGENSPPIESSMRYILHAGQSYHYVRSNQATDFVQWLDAHHGPAGLKGSPRDLPQPLGSGCGSC
jgi:hypothetical protein